MRNGHQIHASWPSLITLTGTSQTYVFGITAPSGADPPKVSLLYHTPDPFTYDVKWELVGWHIETREAILTEEVRDQNARTRTTRTVTAKIGTKPLPYEQPKEA